MNVEQLLKTNFDIRTIEMGRALYSAGLVRDVASGEDADTGLIVITGTVSNRLSGNSFDVRVTLDPSETWIIDGQCDCSFYNHDRSYCRHIAAVLLKYDEECKAAEIGSGYRRPVRHSDASVRSLLRSFDREDAGTLTGKVQLVPYVSPYESGESLQVEFRCGLKDAHQYVIQNITEFAGLFFEAGRKKYGKSLEFVHTEDAFTPECRPLIRFLLSLCRKEDGYTESRGRSYYSYYSSEQTPGKYLHLKGRYLDEFFQIAEKLEFCVFSLRNIPFPCSVQEQTPSVSLSISQEGTGIVLQGDAPVFYTGNRWLYFYDDTQKAFLKTPRKDIQTERIYHWLSEANHLPQYIEEDDLPAFSRSIYPVMASNTLVLSDGFDPLDYAPLKPSFGVYLDLPQEDLITCELYAVYPAHVFNVLEGIDSENRRDEAAEKEMDQFVTQWFTSFDPVHKRLALTGDEDKLYALLTEGIPQMQERADVYISDRLKKLTVRNMPKINVGVSVSHDLLQLDLITDDMSRDRLAEILSRYERKKKYYRLKNGEFVTIDDSLDDLYDLKDRLNLKNSDLAGGTVELDRYHALYLDELAEDGTLSMQRDVSFRDMIRNMKEEKNYAVPEHLTEIMRPYQKDGFEWLCRLRDNGFSGLLADEMGLGKTLQVIAFLGAWKDRKRTLIVCPASLVYNWSAEFRRFMPSVPCTMINGTAAVRKYRIEHSEPDEVLITSYDLLRRDAAVYRNYEFSCHVIDEAQYIKNASTQAARAVKSIRSSFRIALTGTPIENRLSELWSIFDYLLPGFLGSYKRFRDLYEVPMVRDGDHHAEENLRRMVTPFILRRLKRDVLKDLPDKLEEVYYAEMTGEQKELYDARILRLKLLLEQQTDREFRENKLLVISELTRLRQICCDPQLIYDRYTAGSAKSDLCIDMIRNAVDSGHKVLLFSQFTSMLEILTQRLEEAGLQYHLLVGSTPQVQRASMVESFQTDDIPVFCISLKAGGTGLNLTAADVVIHYDPWWNTAVENQASDRAHRIGQENIVTVYRLIMKDTIEERILELQQEKSGLADRILSADEISSASLTREDLLRII